MRLASAVVLTGLLLPLSPARSQDDPEFDRIALQGIEKVYNLEFGAADTLFRGLIASNPSHPAGYFFLAMVDWWRIMVDREDTRYDDRFLEALDHVVGMCDDLLDEDENDVDALFFKGGSLGFTGRLSFYRNDWFGAASAGRRALPLVQTAFAADPGNYDIYLGTGIYNYYASVIPELYPVAKPLLLFIPPGDRETGLSQLRLAASKGKFAGVEARYFLIQINLLYEKNYAEALSLSLELHERFPRNMLFHRYVGRTYVMMSNYAMAREIFHEIVLRRKAEWPGYDIKLEREAEYYLGLCGLQTGSFATGIDHFIRSDRLSAIIDQDGPSAFMVLANLHLGKIYDAQDRRDMAIVQYEKVLEMTDYQDSRAQAKQF
ncbi:MAG: TTC39/IML2 family protein, partial [Ignavibacteria bacterium]|nr:TTC39/IML2 family protein [Ignavibacteria bacterium]